LRKNEDLFTGEDDPDLWTCKNCNNHNIDLKKNCSKCGKNKINQEFEEVQKAKEKKEK
jgi:hypothetical protein